MCFRLPCLPVYEFGFGLGCMRMAGWLAGWLAVCMPIWPCLSFFGGIYVLQREGLLTRSLAYVLYYAYTFLSGIFIYIYCTYINLRYI